jgi:hypothetical protein
MGEFTQMVQDDYGIKKKPIIKYKKNYINKRKPQTNNKIERKHQMIGNMTQTQQVESEDINKNDL